MLVVGGLCFERLHFGGGKIPTLTGLFFRAGSAAIPWVLLILICCLLLVACGSTPAPVSHRPPPPSQKINHHVVAQGDTLFAIAWRYELSVESLARANGLSRPYNIYLGQRLTLDMSGARAAYSKPVPVARPRPVKDVRPASGQPAVKKSSRVAQPKHYPLPKGKWLWQWPVKGAVSRHYDTNRVFKGLDIQSSKGREVGSAAPGIVVYAGQGLRAYGQLLIIKHSEIYLSAYAHNRKMYVKEGQKVAAGQKISEVGGDPENSGRLYFEIRKHGKPVDPMRLLPRL